MNSGRLRVASRVEDSRADERVCSLSPLFLSLTLFSNDSDAAQPFVVARVRVRHSQASPTCQSSSASSSTSSGSGSAFEAKLGAPSHPVAVEAAVDVCQRLVKAAENAQVPVEPSPETGTVASRPPPPGTVGAMAMITKTREAYIVLMLRRSAAIMRRHVQTEHFNFWVRDIAEDVRLEMADNGEEEEGLGDDRRALLEMLVSVAFNPKRQRELEEAILELVILWRGP